MSSASTDLVSVIVPICNVQKYLAECLESILAQTHEELERSEERRVGKECLA